MDTKIDLSNIVLETDRLILRAFREDDLKDLYNYASVPGVGEMAGWPHHTSIEVSKEILNSFLKNKEVFALEHKTDKKVIGSLGIHNSWANEDEKFKDLKVKKIGYVLSKDYWGQGLMPEAVNKVLDYAFNMLGLDAISCEHFKDNLQSKRVIEKSGFKFVKEGKFTSNSLGKTFDEMEYILFKKDFN